MNGNDSQKPRHLTRVEVFVDRVSNRLLERTQERGFAAALVAFLVFGSYKNV